MSFGKVIIEAARQIEEEEGPLPRRNRPKRRTAHSCRYCYTLIPEDATFCEDCRQELNQGFAVRSLAGRCANGAERDHGRLHHALPFTRDGISHKALCGATPGPRSAGWSTWGQGEKVTCERCLRKMKNQ
jgi:hypothetical protein